jgi:hypothetical protein
MSGGASPLWQRAAADSRSSLVRSRPPRSVLRCARFQFERDGYFSADRDSTADDPLFNRTVSLRDPWAAIAKG